MNKQKAIEKFLSEPIKVGDVVRVRGLGIQDKHAMGSYTNVIELGDNDSIFITVYKSLKEVKKEDYEKVVSHIGHYPFTDKPWNARLRMVNFSLESILHGIFDVRDRQSFKSEILDGVEVMEMNWNPTIIDENGNDIVYQRDFCWSLKDNQLLIDSIYNHLDIGKIVIRKRSFDWVRQQIKLGKQVAFKDIVDGKQRLNAIISFIRGDFADSNGFYWGDLSNDAQRKFTSFQGVSYGEIEEGASDEDVKNIFLGINFTGVQMSQEHIDFVKGINLKK
jgi:hypothetical protein